MTGRVTVLGGGAAGAMAAIAARRAGAEVRVRRRAGGATALGSGAVDLAGDPLELPGDPWDGRPPLSRCLAEMLRRNPRHPLGAARDHVEAALAAFCEATDLYDARPLDAPALVLPTDLGTFKSTALAQRSQAGAHLPGLAGRRVAVVGLRGWLPFPARYLAAAYAEWARAGGVQAEFSAVEVALPDEDLPLRGACELAERLAAPGEAERLGEAIAAAAGDASIAIVPPVLGTGGSRVPDRVAAAAGRHVAEALASELSVPGLRLARALDTAVAAAGARVEPAGDPASLAEGEPVVLATGRFLGGGIALGGGVPVESVFGLPVDIDGADARHAAAHLGPDAGARHGLARAGVRVDACLRALGRDRPARGGLLWAAGEVAGGFDPVAERCGLGTAIVTGWAAGRAAAEAACG